MSNLPILFISGRSASAADPFASGLRCVWRAPMRVHRPARTRRALRAAAVGAKGKARRVRSAGERRNRLGADDAQPGGGECDGGRRHRVSGVGFALLQVQYEGDGVVGWVSDLSGLRLFKMRVAASPATHMLRFASAAHPHAPKSALRGRSLCEALPMRGWLCRWTGWPERRVLPLKSLRGRLVV